jgi:hypothetical protein
MPFPLYDSIDGVVLNGYVDGLNNDFEQEDFNPPAETEGRCRRNRAGVTQHITTHCSTYRGGNANDTGGNR